MGALISSVCCTLIILAFCQVIVETILPEGGTKRFVLFITGIVAVTVIVSAVALHWPDVLKAVYSGKAAFADAAERANRADAAAEGIDPYREYIEKLIGSSGNKR